MITSERLYCKEKKNESAKILTNRSKSTFHWGETYKPRFLGVRCYCAQLLRCLAVTLTSAVTTTQAEVDYQLSTSSVIQPTITLRGVMYLIWWRGGFGVYWFSTELAWIQSFCAGRVCYRASEMATHRVEQESSTSK